MVAYRSKHVALPLIALLAVAGFHRALAQPVPVSPSPPNMSCEGTDFRQWDGCVGVANYPNGNVYRGEFHHGMREGFGVIAINAKGVSNENNILSDERSIYIGKFRNGRLNGRGVWITASGVGYVGTYVNNIPQSDVSQNNCVGPPSTWTNCVGTLSYGNGNTYRGEFMQGRRDGIGLLQIRATGVSDVNDIRMPVPGIYVGEFRQGRLNGHGVVIMPGAGFYGIFANNMLTLSSSPPSAPDAASAGQDVVVQANIAPPPLPDYDQPPCPVAGWIWTPGYWGWEAAGYYWVPGTWVAPPSVGLLWTPGYWGFEGGVYVWHAGYWGPHVGFYGGVNYGFGYTGVGFVGGRWVGGVFSYNRAVANVDVTIVHDIYEEPIVGQAHFTRVSYNGGAGGITALPTADERRAIQESHIQPTFEQRQHIETAQHNPALWVRSNGGHPPIAATPRPGVFNSTGPLHARDSTPPLAQRGGPASTQHPARLQLNRRNVEHPAAHLNPPRKPAIQRAQENDRDKHQG